MVGRDLRPVFLASHTTHSPTYLELCVVFDRKWFWDCFAGLPEILSQVDFYPSCNRRDGNIVYGSLKRVFACPANSLHRVKNPRRPRCGLHRHSGLDPVFDRTRTRYLLCPTPRHVVLFSQRQLIQTLTQNSIVKETSSNAQSAG